MINYLALALAGASVLAQAVSSYADANYSSVDENCVSCDSYGQLSASEKLGTLWSKIEDSKYAQLPVDWIKVQDVPVLTDGLDVNFIFDRFSDERPDDVARFFHEYGSVAKVEWVAPSTQSNFTGLFQGSDYGLLRISHCAPLITLGTRPPYSFALKMLRSGIYSANVITCEPPLRDDEEGAADDDYNVFRRILTTSTRLGANNQELFSAAQSVTGFLSNAEPALFGQDGEAEAEAVIPPLIIFEPNQELADSLPGNVDFRLDLPMIKEGTTLYTGYATVDDFGKPEMCMCYDTAEGTLPCWTLAQAEEAGCNIVNLGDIKTTSEFLTSDYGDNKLMFKHTRFCESERITCEGEDPVEGYSNRYPIEGKMERGAQCISKRQTADLQCPFMRNVKKTPNCEDVLDNAESQCPMLNGMHPSLTRDDFTAYPTEGELLDECILHGGLGGQAMDLGVIPKGCCASIDAFFGGYFAGGNTTVTGITRATVDREFLCEPSCLSILETWGMTPALCSAPEELACEGDQVRIYLIENEAFGAQEGQCSESCLPEFALQFFEGEELGSCEEAGYSTYVDTIEVNFAFPVKVAIYSDASASDPSSGADVSELPSGVDASEQSSGVDASEPSSSVDVGEPSSSALLYCNSYFIMWRLASLLF